MIIKEIKDSKLISNVFRSLTRSSPLQVKITTDDETVVRGELLFLDRKGTSPAVSIKDYRLSLNQIILVYYVHKEIIYRFKTPIIDCKDNLYYIEIPCNVTSLFNRFVPRYKIPEDFKDNYYIEFHSKKDRYILSDISINGMRFLSDKKFECGEIIKNALLSLDNILNLQVDFKIVYSRKDNDIFINGVNFLNLDLKERNKLQTFIISSTHPHLNNLLLFEEDKIYNLYDKSGYLSLKDSNEMNRNFMNMINNFNNIKRNCYISSHPVYCKDSKLLSTASVIRIYNGTFLAQQLASIPEARLNLSSRNEIYLALCEYLLCNPYFEYHLAYFDATLKWHSEMYGYFSSFINDESKFLIDTIGLLEYSGFNSKANPENPEKKYSLAPILEYSEFINYCKNNLEDIVSNTYYYNEDFFQNQISQVFDLIGLFMVRRLFGIYKDGVLISYCVCEFYPDGLNLYNLLDMARFYLLDEYIDLNEMFDDIIPEIAVYYKKYGKTKFNILIKSDEETLRSITTKGIKYSHLLGRAFIDRKGLSFYHKLVMLSTR
ncbi:MAG TPA: PilZ domain-containing protein [Clostridia bacterium]